MFIVLFSAVVACAGAAGTSYEIGHGSLTAAGAPGLVGAGYWLVFSAAQPAGYTDMSSANYRLEGGYISGIVSVLEATKSIIDIQAPTGTGYNGNPDDVVPGSRITFKLEFENKGEAARNAVVDDPIPSDMTYYSGSIEIITNDTTTTNDDDHTDGCGYLSATASVNCLIPNIAAGATGAIVFDATVN